ncbi:MAG: hypothetical protein ACRDFY_09770, partial [Candidatus Limnocylindria bacterium]
LHAQLGPRVVPAQVEDPQAADLDPPQAAALVRWIDRATGGGRPLGPDRLGLQRCVQRPRVAGAVKARLGRGRAIRREGRRIDAGLAVDAAAEFAERAQT